MDLEVPLELRLILATAAGVLAMVVAELTGRRRDVPAPTSWGNRAGFLMLVAWDVLALTFAILTWAELWRMSPEQTEQDADREEPPVDVVMMLVVSGAGEPGRGGLPDDAEARRLVRYRHRGGLVACRAHTVRP